MYSIEQINSATIKELLEFAEVGDSVSNVLTPEEEKELLEAKRLVAALETKATVRAELIIDRVRTEIAASDYDGSFEKTHGYSEDDAGDIVSDFGGSIAYDLGMDFDGSEFWESSSC